jgi:uncharacterized protein involved in type VI secretion and phage assembly
MITNDNDRKGSDEMTGVVVGEVTKNDDPDDMGRVKVTFPWRETSDETYWARTMTPMAGDDMGAYCLPEVGDEVLVAFAHGDQRFPYVLGSLWNSDQKPPETNEGNNDVRAVHSRSGHEVTLDDGDSDGKVEITSSSGHTVTLDDATGSEKITIEDKSGQNSVEFDATAGTLTIEGGTKLELKATNIDIEGQGRVNIQASGMLQLKGTMIKLN